MEISTGLRCDSKKCKPLQKSHRVPQGSLLRRRGQRRQTWADARVGTYRRRANSIHRQCQRDVTSQHQATGAKHLESVLAIVCVIERSKRIGADQAAPGFSALSPGRDTGGARDSRHHPGLEWPKRAAPPRPPRNKGRSAHARSLGSRTDITPPVPLAVGPSASAPGTPRENSAGS